MKVTRYEPGPRFAQVVAVGEWIFLAGQVAGDPSQPVDNQAEQIFKEIDRLLKKVGSDKRHLVSVNVYLADISDFPAMNAVWDKWIAHDAMPVRATVETRLAATQYRIEIQATAVRKEGAQ